MKSAYTSAPSMCKADDNNELDDRSSDEDIFYPTSNEPSREDTYLSPRGSRESKPNRDHRSSPRGQKSDTLKRGRRDSRRDSRDEYNRQLLDSLDRQEKEIKNLETKVRSLRKEVRECFSNLEQKLSSFEVKVDLIVNLVSSWFQNPSSDRRCRGFCTKHVRTDKCLCHGLKEPHRCCGHIGGVCDC